jgi:hypothetical protein
MAHPNGYARAMRPLALLLALLAAGCGAAPEPAPSEPPMWLFLLAGQSNMAGRGAVENLDSTPHPRVFALDRDMAWGPAHEPLHWDKPDIAGVGPGFAFGRAMAERFPEARIGLIPAAVGGSSIRAWVPGGFHEQTKSHPWDDAIARTNEAIRLTGGELRGVIWHQGESDAKDFADEYEGALADLVVRLRREFSQPDLPFVAGQLGQFLAAERPETAQINAVFGRLPARVPATAWVSSADLAHKGDGVHFDTPSVRTLGERYAEAMAGLLRR